jgi:hypothetical protein
MQVNDADPRLGHDCGDVGTNAAARRARAA